MINKYRDVPYVKHGRDLDGLDCWGLVRLVRIDMGYDELPLFDSVDPLDKRLFTVSQGRCILDFGLQLSSVNQGAIACGYMGRLCYHVGIVVSADGRNMILETDEKTGVCLTTVSRFENRYSKVEYYD